MTEPVEPALLPARLADELVAAGVVTTPAVAAAFRAVPRHVFAPEATLDAVYSRHDAVVTRRATDGTALSSVSSASVQATMLEQTDVRPGMRVLEIGSGGYNAALLAHLVGPEGEVATIDIDPWVVDRTRTFLAAVGADRVRVELGDAEEGCAAHAPYDRVLVTVRAWDVPPAWTAQLVEGGILTVPLEIRGLTRSLALRRTGPMLAGGPGLTCGFVAMQGAGERPETVVSVRDGAIVLRLDDGPVLDPDELERLLAGPACEVWTGVAVARRDLFGTLPMWLATVLDGYASMVLGPDTGLAAPVVSIGTPAAVAQGAFGYLAVRPVGDRLVELGGHGFGPTGPRLAAEIAEAAHAWSDHHRAGPEITVHPATATVDPPAIGRLVRRRHTVIRLAWASSQ